MDMNLTSISVEPDPEESLFVALQLTPGLRDY